MEWGPVAEMSVDDCLVEIPGLERLVHRQNFENPNRFPLEIESFPQLAESIPPVLLRVVAIPPMLG